MDFVLLQCWLNAPYPLPPLSNSPSLQLFQTKEQRAYSNLFARGPRSLLSSPASARSFHGRCHLYSANEAENETSAH